MTQTYADGSWLKPARFLKGTRETGFAVGQLAQKAYLAPMGLPPGLGPGLDAPHAYDPPART